MTDHATIDAADLHLHAHELTAAPDHLLLNLAATIRHQPTTGPTDSPSTHHKITGSPAPWNDHTAGLYFTIAAAARKHEANLTLLLFRAARYRGDHHTQTTAAIRALPDLITAAHTRGHASHWAVRHALRDLTTWPRQCRVALDEARTGEIPWTKAPGDLRCPYCDRRLLLEPGWERTAGAGAPIWCRACPHRLEGEDDRRVVHRSWPADAWVAVLNHGDETRRGA